MSTSAKPESGRPFFWRFRVGSDSWQAWNLGSGVEWLYPYFHSAEHDGAGKSLDKSAGKPGEGYQTESLTASSFPYQRAKRPILLQGGGWVGWDPFVLCV